jgi:NAD(P)-dependent dehydrogenase (short-subunit alcohol dehydrogenase family)
MVEAVDEASFDDNFAVNVKGQFFTLQKVLPLLQEGASVVLMTALGRTHWNGRGRRPPGCVPGVAGSAVHQRLGHPDRRWYERLHVT